MHRIQPGKYFTIARKLPDPSDSTTYYVQAVIRNANTDAVLETVNLTDRGSRRFAYNWQAYPNINDDGLYITIETSVYTDSGYTVKSDSYQEELETYQIKNEPMHFGGGGMGGGSGIDWKKLRELLVEIVSQNKGKSVDYKSIRRHMDESVGKLIALQQGQSTAFNKALVEIMVAVKGVKLKPTDLTPIMDAISLAHTTVRNMHASMDGLSQPLIDAIEAIPKTDLEPVMKLIGDSHVGTKKELLAAIKGNSKAHLERKFKEFMGGISDVVGEEEQVEDEPVEITSESDVHAILRSGKKQTK